MAHLIPVDIWSLSIVARRRGLLLVRLDDTAWWSIGPAGSGREGDFVPRLCRGVNESASCSLSGHIVRCSRAQDRRRPLLDALLGEILNVWRSDPRSDML